MVEREFTSPEREVRTFSIAVSKKDAEGNDVTRWIRCDDWNRLSRLVGKGDRVKVKGHFRERTYLLARRRAASASRTSVARTWHQAE